MKNYYLPNSHAYYLTDFWKNERKFLSQENATLLTLEQSNQIDFERFLTKKDSDLKPHLNKNYRYLTIPYELPDVVYNKITSAEIIAEVLNKYIHGRKILASTDKDKCCVVECKNLTDVMINCLHSPHLNTPFIIFNPDENVFALIDFDLPLQIIGYARDFTIEIDNYDFIHQGFETVFQRYASYTNMGNLFKEYYAFLLPKYITDKF